MQHAPQTEGSADVTLMGKGTRGDRTQKEAPAVVGALGPDPRVQGAHPAWSSVTRGDDNTAMEPGPHGSQGNVGVTSHFSTHGLQAPWAIA